MKKHPLKNRKIILTHVTIFFVLFIYVAIIWKTRLDCPFKMLFGIPCPFCGITTAFVNLFRLDFHAAFAANPLFLLAPPFIFFAFHKNLFPKIPVKLYNSVLISCAILFFLLFIYRLC